MTLEEKLLKTHGPDIVVVSKTTWEKIMEHATPGVGKLFEVPPGSDGFPQQITHVHLTTWNSCGLTWMK